MTHKQIVNALAEDGSEFQINEYADGAVTLVSRVYNNTNVITLSGREFRELADAIAAWREVK